MMTPEAAFTDTREQRKFGFTMAGAIAVLGLARWGFHLWRGHDASFPVYFFAVAAVFLILALIAPALLQPVFRAWMKFALAINWVVTHVALTVAFVFMITPVRYCVKFFSTDPLQRDWKPDADTYWEEPDTQPDDLDSYKNQF